MLRTEYAKKSRFLLILLMVVLCCLCLSAEAEIINGLTIEDKNGVRTVTAFDGSTTEVVVPEGVEAIGDGVFQGVKATSITLPSTLRTIGYGVFAGCDVISMELPATLETIGDQAFYNCSKLKHIVISSSIKSIGYGFFSNCVDLETVHLPEGLEKIGRYSFCECTSLTNIDIPQTVKLIEEDAFLECINLNSIDLSSVEVIEAGAFLYCENLQSIKLSPTLRSVGQSAFGSCTSSEMITLPDNIESFGENAFGESILFADLESKTVYSMARPKSDRKYSFIDTQYPNMQWYYLASDNEEAPKLVLSDYWGTETTQVQIPTETHIIGKYAFSYAKIKSMTIPDNIKVIEEGAFLGCDDLKTVYLHDDIEECGEDVFSNCSAIVYCSMKSPTSYALSERGISFTDPNDPDWSWRYGETDELLIGGYNGKESHIALPVEATGIADRAFRRNEIIQSVIIPYGYTHIEDEAFAFSSIESIHFPESLISIGEEAFAGCDVSMLQLPHSLKNIGKEAFRNCWNLKSLTIPKSVTSIPYCIADEALTTLVLPKELTEIADNAFGSYVETVYCYRNSAAHTWATQKGLDVKLLDNLNFSNLVTLTVDQPELHWGNKYIFEVGTTDRWVERVHINLLPPDRRYTLRCTSSDPSIAKVEGDNITFLKAGKVTLLYSIAEVPTKIFGHDSNVYEPVVSYDIPSAVLLPIHSGSVEIKPQNVVPQGANPYYYWEQEDGGCYFDENGSLYFWPWDEGGIRDVTVYSASGVSRNVRLIDYETISTITATSPARKLRKGEIYQPLIIVKVDDFYYNESVLYTLTSSNNAVVKPTSDGRLQAVSTGTATITAKAAVSGKTAVFTVTVSGEAALVLPSHTTKIEANAFVGTAAKTIILPDGCTSIGARAFAGSTQLTEIIIPASVTSIAPDAFEGCSNITVFAPYGSAAHTFAQNTDGITWEEDI